MARINGPGIKVNTRRDLSTPTKKGNIAIRNAVPSLGKADRSARKKSAKRLMERATMGSASDEEDPPDEDTLAQEILKGDDIREVEPDENGIDSSHEQSTIMTMPLKRGRGRPKGSKNKRTPSPPRHMSAHELYFFQNRPGGTKTSNNTLSSVSLLLHEDYFKQVQFYNDRHAAEIFFLYSLHKRSFAQWIFELEESFNICLYGWGSKKALVMDFAAELAALDRPPKIIIVNGYTRNLTIRDILATVMSIVPSLSNQKPGAQPLDTLGTILTGLTTESDDFRLVLLVHSIDSPALRRSNTQAIIARLAASPRIHVVASADSPNFLVLWDMSLQSQFNFLFHDVTTYQPFDAELNVVDDVNELFGRSGRRIDGREGIGYVLKSLTENARRLYTLLVTEQLSAGIDDDDVAVNDEGEDVEDFEVAMGGSKQAEVRSKQNPLATSGGTGIEYRTLYRKAMGELITTNEMGFRTLLKEFYDHQMIVSKKDKMGAELLSVPFRNEELEMILEDLGD